MVMNTQTAIFGRLLAPERNDLVPEAARFILGLSFGGADVERMNELASKARDGALSSEELEELNEYRRAGDILALMQAKARRSLSQLDPKLS